MLDSRRGAGFYDDARRHFRIKIAFHGGARCCWCDQRGRCHWRVEPLDAIDPPPPLGQAGASRATWLRKMQPQFSLVKIFLTTFALVD